MDAYSRGRCFGIYDDGQEKILSRPGWFRAERASGLANKCGP